MKIGFIGAGKAGFSLGKYFVSKDKCVIGYYSRNPRSAIEAAAYTKSKAYDNLDELVGKCDTLFITVPDNTIAQVYEKLKVMDLTGKKIIHCSGAMSSDVFEGIEETGALGYSVHPLCAISGKIIGHIQLETAYFTVEGKSPDEMTEFIRSLGNHVAVISKEDKVKYHGAAVCASNLVVGLYQMATKLLKECNMEEDFALHALDALFHGNAGSIVSKGTKEALTGPVERADEETVRKHLDILSGEDKDIYCMLSKYLVELAKEKNPDRSYDEISHLLDNYK